MGPEGTADDEATGTCCTTGATVGRWVVEACIGEDKSLVAAADTGRTGFLECTRGTAVMVGTADTGMMFGCMQL